MIDINKVYPNSEQIIELDLQEDCNFFFETLKEYFIKRLATTMNNKALLELEIKGLSRYEYEDFSTMGKYIGFPRYKTNFKGIYLYPLLRLGWKSAIFGNFKILNDCYKSKLKDLEFVKIEKTDSLKQFFEELTQESIEEIITGMAYAKYYYWLIDLLDNNLELEKIKKTNLSLQKNNLPKPVKTFAEYLVHDAPEVLAEAIKTAYAKEKPLAFSILIHTLRNEFEKPLLDIKSGDFSDFHKAMKEYFKGNDIGARQLYTLKMNYDEEKRNCKIKINKILKSISKLKPINK